MIKIIVFNKKIKIEQSRNEIIKYMKIYDCFMYHNEDNP